MTDAPQPAAGWYPHPTMPNTQAYWDGGQWTEHVAPGPQAAPIAFVEVRRKRESLTTAQTLVAVVGILAVLGGLLVWRLSAVNDDVECTTDNVNRAFSGQPAKDCD